MPNITVKLLEELGACQDGIDWLEDNFPDGTTLDNAIKSGLHPHYTDVSWFISRCKFCQTEIALDFYKSINPSFQDVGWLINHCKFCQTVKMAKYYKNLNPYDADIEWMIRTFEFRKRPEIIKILEG